MIPPAPPLAPAPQSGDLHAGARARRHPSREPLVWLVVGIPLLTIVAGLFTLWIAFQRADSNVTEDYYKEGLAINRKIERDELARTYGLAGQLTFRPEGGMASLGAATPDSEGVAGASQGPLAIDLDLRGAAQAFEPQVTLRMTHPVRQSLDRQVVLEGVGGGRYKGRLEDGGAVGTRWILAVETPAWRLALAGLNQLGAGSRLAVEAVQSAAKR